MFQRPQIKLDVRTQVDALLRLIGSTSPDNVQAFLTDFFSRPGSQSKILLQRAGMRMWESFFPQAIGNTLRSAFEGDQTVRLVIETKDNDLIYLPWEWLFVRGQSEPLVRLPKYSLIRACPNLPELSLSPLTLPLRVLVVMPNPKMLPTLNFEQSLKALREALPSGKAQPVFLVNELATFEGLVETLETFKPQIVHFEGQIGPYLEPKTNDGDERTAPSPKPFLMMESASNAFPVLDIDKFIDKISAVDVQLLVFGNNDVSSLYNNPVTDMAATLVAKGIPAVLAPTRGVDGRTANSFMSAFYTAILQGASLEDATREARAGVARTDLDWSAFALFANPSVLRYFSLPGLAS